MCCVRMGFNDIAVRIAGPNEEFSKKLGRKEKIIRLLTDMCEAVCKLANVRVTDSNKYKVLNLVYENLEWPNGNKPDEQPPRVPGGFHRTIESFVHEFMHLAGESTFILDPYSDNSYSPSQFYPELPSGALPMSSYELNQRTSLKSDIENEIWEHISRQGEDTPRHSSYHFSPFGSKVYDGTFKFPETKFPEGFQGKHLLNDDPDLAEYVHRVFSWLHHQSADISNPGMKRFFKECLSRVYSRGQINLSLVRQNSFPYEGSVLEFIGLAVEVELKKFDPRKHTVTDEEHSIKTLYDITLKLMKCRKLLMSKSPEELKSLLSNA